MTVVTIQQRRATSTEWSTKNPILKAGEIGFETDTGKVKCGNGVTPWNDLTYISGDVNAVQSTGQSTTQVMSQKAVTDALANKVDKVTGKGLIEPAPVDGKQYARKDDAWVEVSGGTGDVEEAPIDGKQYARKDATWAEVTGDVEEAPLDGRSYARRNAGWQEALAISVPPEDGQILKGSSGDLIGSDIFTAFNQKDPNVSGNEFYVYGNQMKNTVAKGFPFAYASGLFMAGTEGSDPNRTHQVFITTSGIFVRNATGSATSADVSWGSWVKYIEDAPEDGKAYVRKNGNWVDVTTLGI